MKKTFVITLIFGFLIGCVDNNAVSEIKDYVTKTDSREDLTESITEFHTEDLDEEIIGGISIYELTDSDGEIYRIIAEVVQPNQRPAYYEFYFKNGTLNYSRIIEYDKSGSDTLMNSEYYFSGKKLIKQIDKRNNKMDAETVRQVSEFYLVYGKETSE